MQRFAVGLFASLLLGLAGAVHADIAWIDFTGPRVVSHGITQVNNAAGQDGQTRIVRRGHLNLARTGGTDEARYLYLKIASAFKANLTSVWVTVQYYDNGAGGFRLQYDGTASATAQSLPPIRRQYDTDLLLSQTWHLTGFRLQGMQTGGADLRINDRAADATADGSAYIARVMVTKYDPNFSYFPYAVTKPTINGTVAAGEWDDAAGVWLDGPWLDAIQPSRLTFPEEFSGAYFFKYDEMNLYLLGIVTDATPRFNSETDPTRFWAGDGIQLYLGLNDTNPERTSYAAGTDFNLFVNLGPTPGWALSGRALDPVGNNLGITNTPTGYIFELQIPWSTLDTSLTVQPGQRIAWYLFANNSTVQDPSSQQMALGPTGATSPSSNPSGWVRAVLDLKPPE